MLESKLDGILLGNMSHFIHEAFHRKGIVRVAHGTPKNDGNGSIHHLDVVHRHVGDLILQVLETFHGGRIHTAEEINDLKQERVPTDLAEQLGDNRGSSDLMRPGDQASLLIKASRDSG